MKEHCVPAIDVAKGKSMVSLIGSCGEVLISPYEINHNLNDFKKYIEQEQFYLNLNAISRKYNTLIEAQTRLKNEFRMESMKYLLSMKNCLKEVLYSLILL